jgi:hypothetical protein
LVFIMGVGPVLYVYPELDAICEKLRPIWRMADDRRVEPDHTKLNLAGIVAQCKSQP